MNFSKHWNMLQRDKKVRQRKQSARLYKVFANCCSQTQHYLLYIYSNGLGSWKAVAPARSARRLSAELTNVS